jgi:hypothetical protein
MDRVVVMSELVGIMKFVGNIEATATTKAIGTGRVIMVSIKLVIGSISQLRKVICFNFNRVRVRWQRYSVGANGPNYVHYKICLFDFA